jgi:hypothetical protein
MMLRRYLLISILSYMGWMYDARGKASWQTKVWGVLVKALINSKSKIYDMQQFLPFLPLPSLDETITRVKFLFHVILQTLLEFRLNSRPENDK